MSYGQDKADFKGVILNGVRDVKMLFLTYKGSFLLRLYENILTLCHLTASDALSPAKELLSQRCGSLLVKQIDSYSY